MEKIFINPVAKEILIKSHAATNKEGPVDIFSYEPSNGNRSLGNLFLVGNIQGSETDASDDIDVGYVLNLVASLAKREYYANPDLSPKDAFAGSLKKINGVVEEFFKKKDTKINIGIFAIAAEQIHISKLGKFKIFLARDGKNIDILNNIQLFNKEIIEEKEFSNIISGKIIEGDRLLAFYPNRGITAREKSLKDSLLGASQEDFAAQLASIKESKPDFSCVALHIDIQKSTEIASAPRIQPKELQEEEPVAEAAPVQLAATEPEEDAEEPEAIPVVPVSKPEVKVITHQAQEPPMPKIIPSEFARGKRELIFAKHARRLKNMNLTPRHKAIGMGGIALVAILAVIGLKSFVFVNASTKQLNAVISEAHANLKLAEDKKSQSDFIGARSLLLSSLSSLTQTEASGSKKAEEAKNEIMKALDELDGAVDATLSSPVTIPLESGTARLLTRTANAFYAYASQENSGVILKIAADGSVAATTEVKEISPKAMFSSDANVTLVDPDTKKVTALSTAKSTLSTSTFSADGLVHHQLYNDNLYGLTQTGIIKITDAALGHTSAQPWLTDTLAPNAVLLAVDGNVYTLSTTGTLVTYFKGKKTDEAATAVAPESGSLLLTNTDSPDLYLVNPSTGRIYIISKSSGEVSKTLKISAKNISSAALGADDTVYLLSDNKIWKVE